MLGFVRCIACCLLLSLAVGCAPNANGVWQPALPWGRTSAPPPGAAQQGVPPNQAQAAAGGNPWAMPGGRTPPQVTAVPKPSGPREQQSNAYMRELVKRADGLEALAETQKEQLDRLRQLEQKQAEEERNYIIAQREKEQKRWEQQLADQSKQFADKEKRYRGRMDQLKDQSSDLDESNRNLHARLAKSEKSRRLLSDEIDLLKRQLSDTTRQLTETRNVGQETGRRLKALQASTARRRGNASIRANSSFRQAVTAPAVPGLDIRQDGDSVRITVPTDKLFMPGTAALHQGSQIYLDQISQVIAEYFPRQKVGVEAHCDHESFRNGNGQWRNQHQLTAAQAMTIFEQFIARRFNRQQFFTVAHGANHPRFSDGTNQGQVRNRRVELVIYPETYR